MLNKLTWCEREVKLAIEGNSDNANSYIDALKAYTVFAERSATYEESLFTRDILKKMMDGMPLTMLNDNPFEWQHCIPAPVDDGEVLQNIRYNGLFKHIDKNGKTTYTDTNRVVCKSVNTGVVANIKLVNDIIDDVAPITMPYMPEMYVVSIEEYSRYDSNGDFDNIKISKAVKNDNTELDIQRYFTQDEYGVTQEVTEHVFMYHKELAIQKLDNAANL